MKRPRSRCCAPTARWDRGKLLLQHDVLSQADYEELEATDKAAHSEQERARQRILEYGFSEDGVSDTVPIRAPISGAVLDIGTATGELQRSLDNAATIATIANLDTVWVVGDVFERDLGSVQVGRQVNVVVPAYPQVTLTGRVDNISDAIDPTTHTLKLRVVLNNPGHRLKSDMFASIRVPGAPRSRFLLPATAIFYEGDKTYVFVSDPQNKLDKREVAVGRTVDTGGKKNIEVLSGLNDGDKVGGRGQRAAAACERRLTMQGLIRSLIRYRAIVLICFFVMLAAGVFALTRLDIEAYPDPSPPLVEVITQNPSWSAEEMEQQVTVPLETTLNGTPHLDQVRSISIFGLSDVKLYFKFGSERVSRPAGGAEPPGDAATADWFAAAAFAVVADWRDLSLSTGGAGATR